MNTALADARYLSLATIRRDGRMVATPVWFAEADGFYYVFSNRDAGKVKRLRNSPQARIAPCDARGRVTGEWTEAQGWLVTELSDHDAAFRALRAKYGLQMRLLDIAATLGGRIGKRVAIAIEPARQCRAA